VLRRRHLGLPSPDRPLVGVYVLFTEDEAPNPDHARLKPIADGDRFQLYEIRRRNSPQTLVSRTA